MTFKFAGKDGRLCECVIFLFCSAATPNVSIKAEMVAKGGSEFWVVSCVSSGGRPDTDISLVLNSEVEPQREEETDPDTQTSSYFLPAAVYEGQNVTCVFGHPKFTRPVSKVTTLPSFCEYLCFLWTRMRREVKRGRVLRSADVSGVQWFRSGLENSSLDFQGSDSIELQEGQNGIVLGLRVSGTIPHYNLSCSRQGKGRRIGFCCSLFALFEMSRFYL